MNYLPGNRCRRPSVSLFSKGLLVALFYLWSTAVSAQTLVWQDNFDVPTINSNTYTYDLGDGCERNLCGWGNGELQYYTNRSENLRIENGSLILEARRENYNNSAFTSSRLKTEGRLHFKYGTVEARIKLPNMANGLWPAFWTLGTRGPSWPSIGEIDMMEAGASGAIAANMTNKRISSAAHWSNAQGNHEYNVFSRDAAVDLSADYHFYKMVWTSQFIKMYLDNVEYYSFDISGGAAANLSEFHQPHFLLLNLAVGGAYPGINSAAGITAPLPGKMYVDYIKLYQNPGDELYIGNGHVVTNNFGVCPETTPVGDSLNFATDGGLSYWNNLVNIINPAPIAAEGSKVWAVRSNANDWFGMGLDNRYLNLSNFANGSLKFHFKSTYAGQFKVGLKTADGEAWINFAAGAERYGLIRDGSWHAVAIPIADFSSTTGNRNFDLLSVKGAFLFAGDASPAAGDFYFDNIYFSKSATPSPSITGFAVAAKELGSPAFALTPPSSNSNGVFSYASSNTSVATVSGNMVTLVGVGTTVISANQAPSGNYGAGSVSASLVVSYPSPSTNAPIPAIVASKVMSLFSNTYNNVPGINWNPGWNQSTLVSEISIGTNTIKKYSNFNYQGVEFAAALDASVMDSLHIDLWTPNCASFDIYPIVAGQPEQYVRLTPTTYGWNSFSISLKQYTIPLNSIIQLKFSGTAGSIVYWDNLYFFSAPAVTPPSTGPTTAAPTPSVAASNVISLFSNAYNNVPVDTWSASWDQADVADIAIAGNDIKKYSNLAYSGIEFAAKPINAVLMDFFHIDIWTPDAATFQVKLVDFGANGVWGTDDTESLLSFTPTHNGWVSYDLPLSDFSTLASRAHLAQLLLVGSSSTLYVDNIYFYRYTPTYTAPTVRSPLNLCNFSVASALSATVVAGNSLKWYTLSSGGTASSLAPTPSTATVGTKTYYAAQVFSDGKEGPRAAIVVNVTALPATPGLIKGLADISNYVGTDKIVTYSLPAIAGITYSWTLPSGVALVNKNTNGDTVNVNFTAVNAGVGPAGAITVKAINTAGCETALPRTLALTKSLPPAPGAIVASTSNVCMLAGTGATVTYTITPVATANSYQWTVPVGAQIIGSATGNSIAVKYTAAFVAAGAVTVKSVNGTGASTAKSLSVARSLPPTPGTISGTAAIGSYIGTSTLLNYAITPIANANAYVWEKPSGVSLTSGQGTKSITVQYLNAASGAGLLGNISVSAVNGCGQSAAKTIALTKILPLAPSTIIGLANVCAGATANYSFAAASSATEYRIAAPAGCVVKALNNTANTSNILETSVLNFTITFPVNFTSGVLEIGSKNGTGYSSTSKKMTITMTTIGCSSAITGRMGQKPLADQSASSMVVNVYPNPSNGSVTIAIQTKDKGSAAQVRIANQFGQTVFEKTAVNQNGKAELKVKTRLANGLYIVTTRVGAETVTQSIIINN